MQRIDVRVKAREQSYEIRIGDRLLTSLGSEVRAALGPGARRAAIVSNKTVFDLFGEQSDRSLRAADFLVSKWLMRDGERHKSLSSLNQVLNFLVDAGIERSDVLLSLGGGVAGDLAGFAAATYMRGIAFVQVPTTLLAQIDASVGGKTGVNMSAGKNLVGAFHQPRLVLIDTGTLKTLPARELTAGWCEAVKQGAVGDRKLFDQTVRFLRERSIEGGLWSVQDESTTSLTDLIAAHCRFKCSIVARDEREDIGRVDRHSRRILNFGHTTAHGLESVTGYRCFRHGEAVGYGMLVAGEISKGLGMLSASELELLREAVRLCGKFPRADDLSIDKIIDTLSRDKKAVSGVVKWVLLEHIGRPRIVNGAEIRKSLLRESLRAGLRPLS